MLAEAMELYFSEDPKELKKSGAWQKIVDLVYKVGNIADRILKYRALIEKTPQIAQWLIGGPDKEPPI